MKTTKKIEINIDVSFWVGVLVGGGTAIITFIIMMKYFL